MSLLSLFLYKHLFLWADGDPVPPTGGGGGGYQTWGELFSKILSNPSRYLFWVIIFLVILFVMSRVNNYLEVKGVDRAIYITRGMVGSIMYFIIAPIIIFMLVAIIAVIYGVKPPDISFLGKWLALTMSSYWWLLKCFFGSAELMNDKNDIYTIHSLVRLLWIIIPITLIWLRMAKSRIGKLLILPFIIGVLVVTRYKTAEETFVTQGLEAKDLSKIPLIGRFFGEPVPGGEKIVQSQGMDSTSRKIIAGGLIFLIGLGFFVGLYLQYRVVSLVIIIIGLLGFLLLAPSSAGNRRSSDHDDDHPINIQLDSLIHQLDSIYAYEGEGIEAYEISQEIQNAYDIQYNSGDVLVDTIWTAYSLCEKYEKYFYDHCHYIQEGK